MWTAFLCCAADLLLRDSHAVNLHVCLCHLDVLFDIKQNKGVCVRSEQLLCCKRENEPNLSSLQ